MTHQFAELIQKMIEYNRGDVLRIQHFIKVHGFASVIAELEGLDPETKFILEAAAIVHDIGIKNSELKYGSSDGKHQEIEGPGEAEKLLRQLGGFSDAQIERVKYLVGHHHTYTDICGIDYQILVEADFLVNLFENAAKYDTAETVRRTIFKTAAGTKILETMFALPEAESR